MKKLPKKIQMMLEKQNIETDDQKRAEKIKANVVLFGKDSSVDHEKLKCLLKELRGDNYE